MKTYEAIKLSYSGDEDKDPSKKGFKTEIEALDYIYSFSCNSCKNSDDDACAAEWMVCEED